MKLDVIKLEKEGIYWTLYIGEFQCGCGNFNNMIEVISELDTEEKALEYAKECQESI